MWIDTETFMRYAKAEKDLWQNAGTVLTQVIKEIERGRGIKIAELRVTMDQSDFANLTMVREYQPVEITLVAGPSATSAATAG